jgi:acyl dehydratase
MGFHLEHDVYVGRDMGGREHVVTPELVARYLEGTDDRPDTYPHTAPGPTIAPPLLFHSEVYADLSWYLPNIIGNLHAKQEWELFHPLHIGDRVCTRSTVVERYLKRNREYVVNEVLITAPNGRWLQRSRTHQSFVREDTTSAGSSTDSGRFVVDKDREKQADRRFEVGTGDGPDLPPLAKTITVGMCQAFSGPHRNYHTDREMAVAMGFPDIVVQGMMSVCFLSELMTRSFGEGWLHGGKLNVSLVNVVWPNDRLAVRGKVREEVREGAHTRVACDVWCEKPDGVKTIVGSASALR